jgi:hypothetical protein
MDVEELRAIPSLPEYEASSWGRVRRIYNLSPMPHGGYRLNGGVARYGSIDRKTGRVLIVFRGKGYVVARLICEAFHGPKPFPKAVVMHRDDNPANNRADNLRYGTQKENLNTPKFIEFCKSRVGDKHPKAIAKRKRKE